jgi:hypothetical protein
MKSPVCVAAIAMVALATSFWTVSGEAKTRTSGTKPAAPKVEMFAVVKDGDSIKVVKKSELVTLKKKAADDYKSALKAYQEAKKKPSKDKDPADAKELVKPVKHTWTTLKDSFKTEDDAKAWKDDLLQKREELNASKKTDASH